MDLQKEREAFEKECKLLCYKGNMVMSNLGNFYNNEQTNWMWQMWLSSKAQAVPEQDQQVWATSNLTWKDIAFRALTCKVLKSTENWVHVKNIACVGSTTASLICKKLGVDPDGTKFELIEAQEPAND